MVGFVKKKVKSYTLGERLRHKREELKVSLEEAAKITKVRMEYLEKMEEGAYEKLPADVYLKGFLRSYAKMLGLDAKEVIQIYERERGIQNNIKKHQLPAAKERSFHIPTITITSHMFAVAAFFALVAGGGIYFYKEIGKFSETPRLVVVQPSSDVSIDGSTFDVIGLTDIANKVNINGQPVFVNEKGEFKETISLQKGINQISIKSVNRFGKESEKVFNISAHYEVEVAERLQEQQVQENVLGTAVERKPGVVALEIRVEEMPTWISIEVDGRNQYSGTMLPGSVQSFEGGRISVTSGKASRTFIKLNGNDIGSLGTEPGVVRDVVFTGDTTVMPEPAPEPEDEKVNDKKEDKENDSKKEKNEDDKKKD